jgi:GMP synthase-like glutamine amidotransferase
MREEQADQIQQDILRRMAPAERLRLACEMSDLARELCRARICQEHPEWTAEQVMRELVRSAFSPHPSPL